MHADLLTHEARSRISAMQRDAAAHRLLAPQRAAHGWRKTIAHGLHVLAEFVEPST